MISKQSYNFSHIFYSTRKCEPILYKSFQLSINYLHYLNLTSIINT